MEERAAAARELASDAVLALQDEALLLEDGDHALSARVLRFLGPRFVYCTALLLPKDARRLDFLNRVSLRDHLNRAQTPVHDEHDRSHAFGIVTHAWIDDNGDLKIKFKLLVDSTKSRALVRDVCSGQKGAVAMGYSAYGVIVEVSLCAKAWPDGARVLSISE